MRTEHSSKDVNIDARDKIPKRTGEIPCVIGGSSQLLVESHRPSGLVRENYQKTGVEAWISRHVELYYITTCHENRPLHLHAVEPGNLADSYRRFIRIVPIDCQSKRRDVCTAAQRGRGDIVVVL